jgi:uncharacterized integral membrane protein
MSRSLFLICLAVITMIALLISAMNPVRVEIELAFSRIGSSLGIALVIAFALGLIAGVFWRVYWIGELLNERGKLRRELRLAQARERQAAVANAASGEAIT